MFKKLLQQMVRVCLIALVVVVSMAPAKSNQPGQAFALEDFFVGKVEAQGSFSSAFAGTAQTFTMTMNGELRNGVLVIDQEVFREDGSTEKATWEIQRSGNSTYTGTRTFAVEPIEIKIKRNTVEWEYKLNMPVDGGGRRTLSFEDTMVLRPDGTVYRVGRVKKFGFSVAEVETTYRRVSSEPRSESSSLQKT